MGHMSRRARRPKRRALNLMELVIVMLIMGIMAAVAVPRYVDSVCRFRVEAAARRLATDLEYARQNAKTESILQGVTFNVNSNQSALSAKRPQGRVAESA
jgi:prepilin-type N-terminal cleavage/methylation domain-containing protein